MNELQQAYGVAREIYSTNRKSGMTPDTAFSRAVSKLTILYPGLSPLRIREIATLAMV
ncbi:MAG: hypothetical protein RQ801_07695 [Spirochaetaceae bacterium]|nr:hypothetical protein [Spirochaetaceae bacterium]MDT8298164.1 hypothetical protein [Spirochaetaceae bacterium]